MKIKMEMLEGCARCNVPIFPSMSKVVGENWCGKDKPFFCDKCSNDIYNAFNVPESINRIKFREDDRSGGLEITLRSEGGKTVVVCSEEGEDQIEMISRGATLLGIKQ